MIFVYSFASNMILSYIFLSAKKQKQKNTSLFMLFQQPFVLPNPTWFDDLTIVMEIPMCIAVAQQQLIDGHIIVVQ